MPAGLLRRKVKQGDLKMRIKTTVIGSHPVVGDGDEAVKAAVLDQIEAGIDIISDGQTRKDMIAYFADHIPGFKVEDGKVVAVGADGKPIYSKSRIGEVAEFDEAVSILVEGYAHKDAILKAPSKGGSGSDGKGGERGGDVRFVKRGDFAGMAPGEQAAVAAKAKAGEVQIVD